MKKPFFLLLIISLVLIVSCNDDDDDETLVGNWVNRYEIKGVARNNANTFVINDKVYIICGYGSYKPYYLRDVWEYDPATTNWARKDSFPTTYGDTKVAVPARINAVSFSIDSIGYYGLGYSEDLNLLDDFWSFNPRTNEWKQVAKFEGVARQGAIGFSINGKGYIVGGDSKTGLLNDQWEYDPKTNKWIETQGIGSFRGSKRRNGFTFTIGNKVYVGSGYNNGYLKDFWVYDGDANTWTEKRKIANISDESYDDDYALPRINASTFVINGKGYVVGGSNGSVLNDAWEYDPLTDLWKRKSYFEGISRTNASSFSINNRGFMLLGNNGSGYFSDIWEFLPDAEADDTDN
jgi:N-acetylneuraminic acid mutarotase